MTIEMLRKEFTKEVCVTCNIGSDPMMICPNPCTVYLKWLEQKLTQPCPECEKVRKLIHEAGSLDMGTYTHVDTEVWEDIVKWTYDERKVVK